MAISQLKDGRWIVYYRAKIDGVSKLKKEYFGRGDQAKKKAQARNDELKLKKRRPPETGPMVWELARAYMRHHDFNLTSRKNLKNRLEKNILPTLGSIRAVKLTDDDMDHYKSKRMAEGVKMSTIAREMTDIKSILNFAVARRPPLIPYNPIISYKKPAPDDAVIDPPTHDELRRIIAASCPHLVRAIMLSYYMGLRPGKVELFSITWDAVRWEHNYISVSAAAKGANKYKSRRPRHVPIHPALLPLLKIWHAQDHGIGHIISFRSNPISSISIAWSNALKRAGITRRIRPYDLRHVFITQAIEAGADMKSLSDIVGSRAQTLISSYQHVTKKMHRAAMDKIPILNVDDTGDTNKISPDVD